MSWNIPNILTVLRLLAAPCVPLAYIVFASPFSDWVALSLFVGASFTDFLDGYLARKWNQTSNFGRMLDPIADKAMVVIALLVVVSLSGQNVWVLIPVVAIMFREIFVSGLREFLGANAGLLQVTKLAKWKTTAQMVAIAALMLGQIEVFKIVYDVGLVLIWIAALLTLITGFDYFRKSLPFLREEN